MFGEKFHENRRWPKYCASCRELLVSLLQGEAIQPSLRPHTPRSASTMGILTPHCSFFCNCHLWKFGYAHMGGMRSWIIWLAALHYQVGRYLRFERRKYGSDQSWFKGSAPTECSTQRQATLVRCRVFIPCTSDIREWSHTCIWLSCRCSRKLSLVEGRFSKWV